MRKAPAALAFTTLVLLNGACSDSVSPPVSPELETVMAADLGGSGLSKEDQASVKAVVKYLADNGHNNGAAFLPSGTTGFFQIEIVTDDGGGVALRACAFLGEGQSDWDRVGPTGTVMIHKAVRDAFAIYFPGTPGAPEYQGSGNFSMKSSGTVQTIRDPSGGKAKVIVPGQGARISWGTGWVQELVGWDDQGQPIYEGDPRKLQCGEVIDASGATRRAGIFFR
jgi:hypothetical protein